MHIWSASIELACVLYEWLQFWSCVASCMLQRLHQNSIDYLLLLIDRGSVEFSTTDPTTGYYSYNTIITCRLEEYHPWLIKFIIYSMIFSETSQPYQNRIGTNQFLICISTSIRHLGEASYMDFLAARPLAF